VRGKELDRREKKTINQAIKWGNAEKNLSLVTRLTMHKQDPHTPNKKTIVIWQICKIIVELDWSQLVTFLYSQLKLRFHCVDKRRELGRAKWDNFFFVLLMLFNASDVILDILITNHFSHQQNVLHFMLCYMLSTLLLCYAILEHCITVLCLIAYQDLSSLRMWCIYFHRRAIYGLRLCFYNKKWILWGI